MNRRSGRLQTVLRESLEALVVEPYQLVAKFGKAMVKRGDGGKIVRL